MADVKYGANFKAGATKGQPPLTVDSELIAMIGCFPTDKETSPTKGKPKAWYTCISWDDFKSGYGYEEFWGTGNLARSGGFVSSKSVEAIMKGFGVQPVLIYNIFDPSTHQTVITDESVTFTAFATPQPVANKWAFIDTFVVTDDPMTVTYVEGTDYTLERNATTGLVEITTLSTGSIGATDSVLVDYDHADPTAVTTANVTAGIDEVQNIITALGFKYLPGWITCPKYSQIAVSGTVPATIRASLKTNAQALNTVFTTRFVYDIDETDYNTTVTAGSPDLTKIKDDKDVASEHGRVFFGEGSATGMTEQLLSDWFLGLQTAEVAANEFPAVSPSNRVLSNYTPANKLPWPVGSNTVRDYGIITTQLDPADRGFTLWGTATAYYAGTATDVRLDDTNQNDLQNWLCKAIVKDTWVNYTDRNFNKLSVQSLVDKWNAQGKQQVSKGKLIGWEVVFLESDNPDLTSFVKFRIYLLAPVPQKRTDFEMQVDLTYLSTVFG